MPDFIVGFGMSWVFVTTTAFLTECVPRQAAGAFALGNLLRTPAAAIAAAAIQPLVTAVGSGWCFTGLATLDLVVVGGSVLILRNKGHAWRERRERRERREEREGAMRGRL
jgi:MFS family permease